MNKNPIKAMEILRLCLNSEPNNVEVLHDVATMYYQGIGVDRDMKAAMQYQLKAANLNYEPSCSKIGDM